MADVVLISDNEQFEKEVLESKIPVAVCFYSEDCLYSQTFDEILKRMADAVGDQMKFIKIQRQENKDLSDKYSIKSSPTVIFFSDGREVCDRLSGYIKYHELKGVMETVLNQPCFTGKRAIVRCDVIVIGAGPAGLTSAIYTARSRLETVVIEANIAGGQVATTFHIANYPGTVGVIKGMDLMENMKKQAIDLGAQIYEFQEIAEIDLLGDEKKVITDYGDFYAKSVIIATGAEPRKLPVENENHYRGNGIHYCATCDGAFYQDANVSVAGSGDSALEEAAFLSRYAKTVTILNRSGRFKGSRSTIDRTLSNPLISVVWNSTIRELKGDDFLESVILEDVNTGERKEFKTDAVFVYIGTEPSSGLFKGQLHLSENGCIPTDENMATNVPGVFAAGDVREKEIRQITTAVGDGTIAGIMAERFIASAQSP